MYNLHVIMQRILFIFIILLFILFIIILFINLFTCQVYSLSMANAFCQADNNIIFYN